MRLSLENMLKQRTHRDLELIARAHKLPFSRRYPKAQGLHDLTTALCGEHFEKAFQNLTDEERDPLRALQAAGKYMPLYLFTLYFGEINLYKPWRRSQAKTISKNQAEMRQHPWRYPTSVAEKLYQLGFITIVDKEMVVLCDDTLHLLSPLPLPQAIDWQGQKPLSTPQTLLTDIAVLIGTLMKIDVRPQWERWLPPSALKAVNERLIIKEGCLTLPPKPQGGDKKLIRSELQTGRLRWLHYLAQVSGLISIQAGLLKPTVAAWQWLGQKHDAVSRLPSHSYDGFYQ
ncbi:MAG: hypothetical protein Q9P01_05670 [Anaerolineae bacterium]|nr:hypothetical protein [Anaerolineae bacterium]